MDSNHNLYYNVVQSMLKLESRLAKVTMLNKSICHLALFALLHLIYFRFEQLLVERIIVEWLG